MTTIIAHDHCQRHVMGPGHPESPARLQSIFRHLKDSGLAAELNWLKAEPARLEDIERVHSASHFHYLNNLQSDDRLAYIDGDTALCPDSFEAALLAAGATVQGVKLLLAGTEQQVFCATRPPGHHAETALSMGFCLFNNIAVGIRYALSQPGIERVALLDFDVHHGNGSVEIFRNDPRVLVCSSFQEHFYPHRFMNVQADHIVNTPLPAGSNSIIFRRAIEAGWLKAIEAHQPDIIFVSAGFDAHKDDPLGGLRLTEDDFAWITEFIVELASVYSHGRVLSTLEGGYNLAALATSVAAHLGSLMENQAC